MTRVALLGDFFAPEGSNPTCDPGVSELLAGCDATLVNVEGPITRSRVSSFKTGPGLRQDPAVAEYLRKIGVTHACLANNHVMDFGLAGVRDTVRECESAGLVPLGADAGDGSPGPLVHIPHAGGSISIINVCEREWIEDSQGRGACAFGTTSTNRLVRAEVSAGNYPVVVLHGGNEYLPFPSPWLRDQARFLVEMGAAAVLMHHTHVVAGQEIFRGAPVAYSLGNFQFLLPSTRPDWHEGLAAVLDFGESAPPELTLVPLEVHSATGRVSLATGDVRRRISNEVASRSSSLSSDAALKAHWDQFLEDKQAMYLRLAFPVGSSGGRALNAGTATLLAHHVRRHPEEAALLLNAIRAESHHAALVATLERLVVAEMTRREEDADVIAGKPRPTWDVEN